MNRNPFSLDRRFRTEWVALASTLVVVALLLSWMLTREFNDLESSEQHRLQVQARVVDENLIRQLEGVDKALQSVRDQLGNRDPTVGAAMATGQLRSLTDAMPGVSAMVLLDANGTVVASSRDELIGRNFSQRDYFTVSRQGGDRKVLYDSPPFRTVLGSFVVVVGRVLTDSNGGFAGIAVASLDPAYFNVVLQSVLYAPDMHSALIGADGKVFINVPAGAPMNDVDPQHVDPGFGTLRREGQAVLSSTDASFASGGPRMVALRSIRRADLPMDKPMVVAVSRDRSALWRPWRNRALEAAGVFMTLGLGLGLALHLSQRRRAVLGEIEAVLAVERQAASVALRDSEDQLRQVTDNLPALVSRLDPEQRFRFANRAYRDWLQLEPAALIGRSLSEVYGEAVHSTFREHIEAALAGAKVVYERDLATPDGVRRVEVMLIPEYADDGSVEGVYALMADISARFEADRSRARSEERLSLALEGSGQALFDWDVAHDRMYQSAHASVMRGEAAEETTMSGAEMRAGVHPEDVVAVMAEVAAVVKGVVPRFHAEFRLARSSGEWTWVRAIGRVVERDDAGRALRVAGTYADINEQKAAEGRLRRRAEVDGLTGLPNRALFNDRLELAMNRATPARPMALLFLDIDFFKAVNDTWGHEAGDAVLKECATRMQAAVRPTDTVARLAGDEFTIILEGMIGAHDAVKVAAKLVHKLREPIRSTGRELAITTSIGVASWTPGDTDQAALLHRADLALYEAKKRGRDGWYCAELDASVISIEALV